MTFAGSKDGGRFTKGENDAARGLGIRHVQVAVMAMATFVAYSIQSNLGVAIVAMVENHNTTNTTNSSVAEDHIQPNTTESTVPTFDWDEKVQGYVLSSFFWGYLVTQIPAGLMSEKYGGHIFLCGAIAVSSLLSLILPQCAYIGGWLLVCLNRMLLGISQGFIFPALYTLLGVWAPPAERSTLSSIAVSAQLLGIVVATPAAGILSSMYGWPSVLYVFGALGAVVCPFMIFLGADSPSDHRLISKAETNYIHSSLGGKKVKLQVPWKIVLTSVPYYAATCAMTFQSIVYIIFVTKSPTFLNTVLNFDVTDSGVVSALPFLLAWILSFVCSWLCDFLIGRKLLRVSAARKMFNSIAHFGGALSLVLLANARDTQMSVILLTLTVGLQAGAFVGVQASFVDLAPNFSGAVFSVANFVCITVSALGPSVVGYIVTEKGSAEQWRIVFYLSAVVLALSNVIFLIWGTSETQWWNWPDRYKSDMYKEEKDKPEKEQNTIC